MSQPIALDSAARAQLAAICQEIVARVLFPEQWAEIESDDEFQSESLVGGYDAIESLFTFSFYDSSGREWWFDVSLEQAARIGSGESVDIALRAPQ